MRDVLDWLQKNHEDAVRGLAAQVLQSYFAFDLHLGAGLHPCAGRAVNAFQIPLLVRALVRRGIKSVGPVQWAGPFPDHLEVRFER